jgi:tetratricopeptide (TPR) repeat protein
MSGSVAPTDVRRLIRDWMTTQQRSMKGLADEAGINRSILSRFLNGRSDLEAGTAIKLYNVMYRYLTTAQRRTFVEATGLLPLASALSPEFLYSPDQRYSNPAQIEPFQVGVNLMMGGHRLAGQLLCAEAIHWFRSAESILGRSSTLAARSACMTALMYAELSNYEQALTELARVPEQYTGIMDPATQELLYRVRGWITYYQGAYAEAEQMFKQCLSIAAESGDERLGETAQHFLGRVYGDWALGSRNPQQRQQLVRKALAALDKAFDLHIRCAFSDDHAGLDLVRKAQLLQAQSESTAAQELRDQARKIFRRNIHKLHIDLDEAQLMLENGEVEHSRHTVHEILEQWSAINKANGMAKALRVLGDIELVNGHPTDALEVYMAALCVHPELGTSASDRDILEIVAEIRSEVIRREGHDHYHLLIQRIQEAAEARQGHFSYLNHIAAERRVAVAEILNRLKSGMLKDPK